MGHKAGPEILRIITSAIAGVTTVVGPLRTAIPLARGDVWIDDVRIPGSKSGVALWEAQVLCNADGRHDREDREPGATQYTFLGAHFDHTHQTVSLSDKFVRLVCAMPVLNSLAVAEVEVVASRFLYAAAVLGTRLFDYYFFIKVVRRRLSAFNRGIVQETSPANLPLSAIGLGERLRHSIENIVVCGPSSPPKRLLPQSPLMRRSVDGESFPFHTPAALKLPVGNGRGSLFLSCRPRHERYAWPYRPFPPSCHST
ncbi:RNA-binding protein, putative [Trypanosoma cruzi]|nr:RNA-binding protein, putative [Trypanosoma cruzi]